MSANATSTFSKAQQTDENKWAVALGLGLLFALSFGGLFGYLSYQINWLIGLFGALFATGALMAVMFVPMRKRNLMPVVRYFFVPALIYSVVAVLLIGLVPLVLTALNADVDATVTQALRLGWVFYAMQVTTLSSSMITTVVGVVGFLLGYFGRINILRQKGQL